jgi:hypothetical protein
MWARAAKEVAKFSEGVLTALDARGYPLSVRQTDLAYDAATGTLPVKLPDSLGAIEGPANLLCHYHNEKLWDMRMAAIKGRLERRDGGWLFVSSAFNPPSMLAQLRGIPRAADAYLEKRGLPRPEVNFAAIAQLWERAAKLQQR